VILRCLERPPEVVEDGQKLFHESLVCAHRQRSGIARASLAVVVELRGEPLKTVEEIVPLGLESGNVNQAVGRLFGSRGNLPVPPNPLHRSAVADGRLRRRIDAASRGVCQGFAASSSITS